MSELGISVTRPQPLTPAEITAVRAQFPYLKRLARNGEPLAYLDWAATSQKPAAVIEREAQFLRDSNGAAGRSTYQIADEATAVWDKAHEVIGNFVGANRNQVVFTKNATEAINVLALSIGHASLGRAARHGGENAAADDPSKALRLGDGDEVVVTRAEHHANLVPWQELCARTGAKLRWLDLTADGRIDTSTLSVLNAHTKILAFTHVSNVTGAVSPLAEILPAAKAVGALVVLDTCQSSAHLPLNFADLSSQGVDAIVLSSHKMLGPTGIGALVATKSLLEAMPAVFTGGAMIETVTMERSTYMPGTARFEAGSQPLAQAAGWIMAVQYLRSLGLERLQAGERQLTRHAIEGIQRIQGVRLLGPADCNDRLGVIAFTVAGVHPHDVGQVLDAAGIAVRTGHHCAQPIHAYFSVRASSRVSFGPTTTMAEIDRFLDALSGVRSYFQR